MDATRRHGDGLQRRQGQGAAPGSSQAMTSAARKEQQLMFLLTRQLVEAQFVRADRERSQRLWQEVAALELDPERITALMYGACDHDDPAELAAVDRVQASTSESHRPAWLRWSRRDLPRQWRGAGRRGAPPAAPRAHRQAR